MSTQPSSLPNSESIDVLRNLPNTFSISISAPGKVILYGEHSVVYGKTAIAASLGLRTKLSLTSLDVPNTIKVELSALKLVHSYDLNDLQEDLLSKIPKKNESSFRHEKLIKAVEIYIFHAVGPIHLNVQQKNSLYVLFYLLAGILGNSDVKVKPFRLEVCTDLTVGAGTGSSASYAVTLAAAFIQYRRILEANGTEDENLTRNSSLLDLSRFSNQELHSISQWALNAEKIVHGSPSGIDNSVCTFGSIVNYEKLNRFHFIKISQALKLLLINTNVQRDTSALVKSVADWKERHPSVIEAVIIAMDKLALDASEYFSQLSWVANEEDVISKLMELMNINHHLLQSLQVSHPKLDEICSILKENKICGKLTGGGGGGYAIALLPLKMSTDSINELIEKLNSKGFEATVTSLGGPGVSIDST